MDGFTVAWLFWFAMFAVIEGVALFNKRRGDTLSEHVWKWFSVKEKSGGWLVRRGVLALFLTWLTVHMLAS
jgi:hypothetical protein